MPVRQRNSDGKNVIHICTEAGRAVTCSLLLSLDPEIVSDMLRERDKDGRLPLHYISGKVIPF
jgi:ankyrin repeat protein